MCWTTCSRQVIHVVSSGQLAELAHMSSTAETFQGLNTVLEDHRNGLARCCQAVDRCLEVNRWKQSCIDLSNAISDLSEPLLKKFDSPQCIQLQGQSQGFLRAVLLSASEADIRLRGIKLAQLHCKGLCSCPESGLKSLQSLQEIGLLSKSWNNFLKSPACEEGCVVAAGPSFHVWISYTWLFPGVCLPAKWELLLSKHQ